MQFLYLSVNQKWDREISDSLRALGQEVVDFSFPEEIETKEFVVLSEINRCVLAETLQKKGYDFVFSVSYIHEVSVFCNMLGVLYLSWIFEYPNMDLMRDSVANPCNCFFISVKGEIERLKSVGAENVFYLPAAALKEVLPERNMPEGDKEESVTNEEKIEKDEYQVSYIGKILEVDENSFFGTDSILSAESRGYLDGLVHCQRVVYGMDLLKDGVPAHVLSELREKYSLNIPGDVTNELWDIYLKKWIYNRVSSQERLVLLQGIDDVVTVFSRDETAYKYVSKAKVFTEEEERKNVVFSSKINLHIADRQIQDGIPCNVFEIMSCGGFLLTSYCAQMWEFFVPDEDFVYFEDERDLKKKIRYYLEEEEKRAEIAQNGREKVWTGHLVIHRMEQMLQILLV